MNTILLTALLASAFSSNIISAPSDTINGNDRLTYAIRMSDQSPIDEFGATGGLGINGFYLAHLYLGKHLHTFHNLTGGYG